MAWEQLSSTPLLLREGHYIFFTGGWPVASGKEGKWFQIARAHQIKYDVNRIVATAASIDLDFIAPAAGGVADKSLSLLPISPDNMYEILLGIKGNVLVYPIYNNSYFQKLEVSNVIPDTANFRLRYLGYWDEEDSPYNRPTLREHLVKDQQPPVLRLYNDMFVDEPCQLRFLINRVHLVEVAAPPPEMQRLARIATYHLGFNY
jgi:hypothetical protein